MAFDVERFATLENELKHVVATVDQINYKLDHKFVTQDQFRPIQRLVYGTVGIILTSVVVAIVTLVVAVKP